jgi:hypothetical protein
LLSNNCRDEIINILSIFNYTKNSSEVNIAAFEVVFRWKKIIFPGLNDYNYNNVSQLINNLISDKYILNFYKRKLLSFLSKLNK